MSYIVIGFARLGGYNYHNDKECAKKTFTLIHHYILLFEITYIKQTYTKAKQTLRYAQKYACIFPVVQQYSFRFLIHCTTGLTSIYSSSIS